MYTDSSLATGDAAMGRLTVDDYPDARARLMITEELGAWTPSIRPMARLRSKPVRQRADRAWPSPRSARAPKALLAVWNYTGLLLESMALRDVRVYLDAIGGTTHHYRDSSDVANISHG